MLQAALTIGPGEFVDGQLLPVDGGDMAGRRRAWMWPEQANNLTHGMAVEGTGAIIYSSLAIELSLQVVEHLLFSVGIDCPAVRFADLGRDGPNQSGKLANERFEVGLGCHVRRHATG